MCFQGEKNKYKEEFDLRKAQTMKVIRERVIDYDDRDQEVWRLITDVPRLTNPWNWICFVLNVIIPGKI